MNSDEFINTNINEERTYGNADLLERLENAYKLYKMCEGILKDVKDDYGKQKIARLRYEFARHELSILMREAHGKGISWKRSDVTNVN